MTAPTQAQGSMRRADLSSDRELAVVLKMIAGLSRAKTPQEVLESYSAGMDELRGRDGFISLSTHGLEPGRYRITRQLTDDNLDEMAQADPWSERDTLPVHEGGVLGGIVQGGEPVLLHHLRIDDDPVLGEALSQYRTLAAMPLYQEGEVRHWSVQLCREAEAMDTRAFRDDVLRANLVGHTVEHVRTAERLREAHTHIRREVDRIAAIQQALLPQPMPKVPGIEIEASYRAFDKAGGDIYDVISLPDEPNEDADRWGILIGDVSGHGPSAAVVMAMLSAILNAYTVPGRHPDDVLTYANKHLVVRRIEQSFVTAFLATYHPATRELAYARAGHNPPLLLTPDADGRPRSIQALDKVGDLPLGVAPGTGYLTATTRLEPGQTLVLYTDGITEARGPDGVMYGEKGLRQTLSACTCDPTTVVPHLRTAVDRHEQGRPASDDQTLLAIRVDG